eukprot:1319257-Amorphochlora_amoeboformis.AAC.2
MDDLASLSFASDISEDLPTAIIPLMRTRSLMYSAGNDDGGEDASDEDTNPRQTAAVMGVDKFDMLPSVRGIGLG